MSQPKRITAPFDNATARSLRAGDSVLVTGTIIAARDAAHKRLVETLQRGEKLPVDLKGAVVYYVGPTPAKPGHPIGSAGPTTSGRMDAYTPTLMGQGLKGMIGKGYRKPEVVEAMKKYCVPYLAAVAALERSLPAPSKNIPCSRMKNWDRKLSRQWKLLIFQLLLSLIPKGIIIIRRGRLRIRRSSLQTTLS